MQGQIVTATDLDPSLWGDYAVKLLGAGGAGLLLRELVKQMFARANKGDDTQTTRRGELRQQVADLIERVDVLDARIEAERERANRLFAANAELKAENVGLRRRYHALLGWLAQQPGLPDPPAWLYEAVEGPTSRDAMPRPSEDRP